MDLTDNFFGDPSGDSGGESFGTGLDSSALGLSGSDALSLDFLGETPLQGSDLSLDFSGGTTYSGGIFDLPGSSDSLSLFHDMSLSGLSDPPPSISLSGPSFNGSGTALSSYHSSVPYSSDTSDINTLFSSVAKFGSAFGTLLHSPSQPATPGQIPNGNPNYMRPTSISNSHAALLIGAALLLVGVIALGGN